MSIFSVNLGNIQKNHLFSMSHTLSLNLGNTNFSGGLYPACLATIPSLLPNVRFKGLAFSPCGSLQIPRPFLRTGWSVRYKSHLPSSSFQLLATWYGQCISTGKTSTTDGPEFRTTNF